MTRARRAGLVLLVAASVLLPAGLASVSLAQDGPVVDRGVLVVLVPGVSFERLLGDPDVRALAARGGAAMMPATESPRDVLLSAYPSEEIWPLPTSTYDLRLLVLEQGSGPAPAPLDELGPAIRATVDELGTGVGELLVVVVGSSRSPAMRAGKDELLPIVVASGPPSVLFAAEGEANALTSDSTRRAGVVAVRDLPATIVAFAGARIEGHPLADAGSGEAIEVVEEPAPFELHERYLAQRRLSVPVGTVGAVYLAIVGLLGLAFVGIGERAPERARRAVGWGCLSTAFVGAGLLAAGHLPELTYATVVPFLAIVVVLGTLAFSPLEVRGAALVPVGLGTTVLAFFVVEALVGWSGMLTPLLGGTHLDGGRFYGLPNVGIGLLIGASLYVAQVLPTRLGVVLVATVALFAGLPYLGSNLGAGVTLFATAGAWLGVRERGRLGAWRGVGVVALSAVAGAAVLLVAHRLSPLPTHVTRFASEAGGLAGAWQTFVDRLGIGIDLLQRNPAALIPVAGLPFALLLVLRPPALVRASFERWPAWRDAVLVCLLGGVVAYLANDTGPAAAGFAFGLGLGGMLGVSLLAGPGKMGAT